jgi:hypothetical protein
VASLRLALRMLEPILTVLKAPSAVTVSRTPQAIKHQSMNKE